MGPAAMDRQQSALIPDVHSLQIEPPKLPNLFLPWCLRDRHSMSAKLALSASQRCFCQQHCAGQASPVSERGRHDLVVLPAGEIPCPKFLRPIRNLLQETRRVHHPSTEHDCLCRHGGINAVTHLGEIAGHEPMGFGVVRKIGKARSPPRLNCRSARQSFEAVAVKRANSGKIPIARFAPRVDVAQFRVTCSVHEPATDNGSASNSGSDRNIG